MAGKSTPPGHDPHSYPLKEPSSITQWLIGGKSMQDPKAEQSPVAVRKCYNKHMVSMQARLAVFALAAKLTDEQQHEMQLFVSCC